MTATKGAIIRTVERLDEQSADFVLDWLSRNVKTIQLNDPWDMIEEAEPDAIDREMLAEIDHNPDCHIFISEEEMDASRLARRKAPVR